MMTEKYNLNQSTLDFLMEYTKLVKSGEVISNQELIGIFKTSKFYSEEVETYYPTAISKSLWYAIHRSDQWLKLGKGKYKRMEVQ